MHFQKKDAKASKVDIQMTPFLDMIFQLLVFFIMTFRPVSNEGQFSISMTEVAGRRLATPTVSQQTPTESIDAVPSIPVILKANPDGRLALNGVILGERALPGILELQAAMRTMAQESPEDVQVAIQADTELQYEFVMQAIDAMTRAGIRVISFAPPIEAP